MRKVFQQPQWRAHSKRRQEDELRRRRRRSATNKKRTRHRHHDLSGRLKNLVAPVVFCLFENPEGVLDFIDAIKATAGRKRRPFVDMSNVTEITPETLAVLLSVVRDDRLKVRVNGNFPENLAARNIVQQSGFLQHVSSRPREAATKDGSIQVNRSRDRVEPGVGRDLVRLARERLGSPGAPATGAYRVLIECMSNTHQHAAMGQRDFRERWYLMVSAPQGAAKATFAFVDNGVGIAESLEKRRILPALKRLLGISNDGDLLKQLLAGEIGSRTGLDYRGRGLPAMRREHERGSISNLRIISNHGLADLSTGRFRHLEHGFSGTVISFNLLR